MGDGIPAKRNISNIFVNIIFLQISRYAIQPMQFLTCSICPVLLQCELCSPYFLCFLLPYPSILNQSFSFLLLVERYVYGLQYNCDSCSKLNIFSHQWECILFDKHITGVREYKRAFMWAAVVVSRLPNIKQMQTESCSHLPMLSRSAK